MQACKNPNGALYFHTIISDCVEDLKHIDHVLIDFFYQSTNRVAHLLASTAHSTPCCGEWHVTPPDFLNLCTRM